MYSIIFAHTYFGGLQTAPFSKSVGNRRERSKAMNIHEYTEIFLNNHGVSTFNGSRLLPALIDRSAT